MASNTNFIVEFLEFLVHFIPKYQNFIITGDFNLHIDNSNDLYGNILKDNIKALGLDQHVNFPTHHSGHTLDLVITEHHNMSSQIVQCESGKFLSDHCAVVCVLNIKKEDIISETKTFRNQMELDVEKLITLFSNINLDSSTHIDGLVEIFEKNVSCILDEYAPKVTRIVIHRKPKAWFNEIIQALKHQLRIREYVWRKYREHHQWTVLKKITNKYVYQINKAKKETLTGLVLESKGDAKKLYNLVAKLTGGNKDNPLPVATSDESLANDFADYFLTKIQTIRDDLAEIPNFCPAKTHNAIPSLRHFEPLSQNEVKSIINNLGTKSCESDIISTQLLKTCLPGLLPPITKIVNVCLSSGVFPNNYKEAIVKDLC